MSEIKEKVEALIFAFGEGISLEDICKHLKADTLLVKKAVTSLNKSYEENKSAFFIVTEGDFYRMRLRDDLMYLVQENLKTDMSKGVLMTLSVIAINGKMKQSDLIKTRGSVSYQHIKELVNRGLVNTYLDDGKKVVKLSPMFYEYFDVDTKDFKELEENVKAEAKKESEHTTEYSGR